MDEWRAYFLPERYRRTVDSLTSRIRAILLRRRVRVHYLLSLTQVTRNRPLRNLSKARSLRPAVPSHEVLKLLFSVG